MQILPNGVSYRIKTIDELVNRIHALLENKGSDHRINHEQKEIASKFMSNLNGAFASEEIITALKDLVSLKSVDLTVKEKGWKQVLRIWSYLRSFKEKVLGQEGYGKHKFPGLGQEEINETIASFRKVTGRFDTVRAISTQRECYYLSVKN